MVVFYKDVDDVIDELKDQIDYLERNIERVSQGLSNDGKIAGESGKATKIDMHKRISSMRGELRGYEYAIRCLTAIDPVLHAAFIKEFDAPIETN